MHVNMALACTHAPMHPPNRVTCDRRPQEARLALHRERMAVWESLDHANHTGDIPDWAAPMMGLPTQPTTDKVATRLAASLRERAIRHACPPSVCLSVCQQVLHAGGQSPYACMPAGFCCSCSPQRAAARGPWHRACLAAVS